MIDVPIQIALSIILVLLFFLMITQIFALMNPDKQIAMLNSDLLRAKINEACAAPDDSQNPAATIDKFSLPQPKPMDFGGFVEFLPAYAIHTGGDPNYVLYYEAFTPGDDVGWEIYQKDFGYRIIAPFTYTYPSGSTTIDPLDFKTQLDAFSKKVQDDANAKYGNSVFGITVMVNNIVLTKSFNTIPNTPVDASKVPGMREAGTGNLGDWANSKRFEFSAYNALTSLEKSLIKYRPCGDNALCLKTREFVYKYELSNACNNIKNIEIIYQANHKIGNILESAGLGTTSIAAGKGMSKVLSKYIPGVGVVVQLIGVDQILSSLVEYYLDYKISDFSIASPCTIDSKIEIYKNKCDSIPQSNRCTKFLSYPIYNYDYNAQSSVTTITQAGEHYYCAEKINNIENPETSPDGSCIRIMVTEPYSGYCWTPDPYKDYTSLWQQITNSDPIKSGIAMVFGLSPTIDNTDFLPDTKSVVLLPPQLYKTKMENWLEALGRKWWWGWPG
jgi:hypothetical protein